jgi:short-subunit dehydrogenase
MDKKLIIITGTTNGLGQELLNMINIKEYNILTINRKEIKYDNDNIKNIVIDLADTKSINNLEINFDVKEIIFINNAFHESFGYIKNFSSSEIISIINTNITSVILLTSIFLKKLKKNQNLKIINITTGVIDSIIPSWSLYCCSKKFIENFMITIDKEYTNVTCINFNPGIFSSNLQKKLRKSTELKINMNNYFDNIYKNKQLQDPKVVVTKILDLI